MILPYPPGLPLLMPGEMIRKESRAVLDFLLMLCSVGRHYPGFETDIHGAVMTQRRYAGESKIKVTACKGAGFRL